MRADTVMNPSRLRILEYFITHGTGTAGELSHELSDIPQASLYRHLKLLSEDGWLELCSERKKRGTTERVYRLARREAEDDAGGSIRAVLCSLLGTFSAYFGGEAPDPVGDMLFVSTSSPMLSDEEFSEFIKAQSLLLKKYLGRPPEEGRRPRRLTYISSPCETEE